LQTILDGVNRASRSDQWRKDGGQFIPFASTWLNQRRWEDGSASTGRTLSVVSDYDDIMRGAL
jgi:hypothetical protein